MNNDISSLLQELYAFAPDLEAHEAEIVPIIEALLAENPKASPHPEFIEDLRRRLRERGSELSLHPSTSSSFFSIMKPVFAAIAGGALTLLVAVPLIMRNTTGAPVTESGEALFSYSVTHDSPEAFGELTGIAPAASRAQGGGGIGIGGVGTADTSAGGIENFDAKIATESMIYPPGGIPQYSFVYEGELPELTAETVDVLKRERGLSGVNFGAIAGRFDTGLIDLDRYSGAQIDSISAVERKSYGYMININLSEGSVFLSQAWEYWPHPESACTSEACYQQYRIKEADVPADDVLVGVAQSFLEDHGVDLTKYGTPEVDRQWRSELLRVASPTDVYIPEVQRVTFPLLVDGKQVIDEGGNPIGISAGVHVKEKRVADVWGLMDQRYRSSAYAAVTDKAQITKFLETIENYSPVALEGEAGAQPDTQIVKLGTPTEGFMKVYKYENNTTEELLVPALIFPIEDMPEDAMIWRKAVTVPLAKDTFDEMMNRGNSEYRAL